MEERIFDQGLELLFFLSFLFDELFALSFLLLQLVDLQSDPFPSPTQVFFDGLPLVLVVGRREADRVRTERDMLRCLSLLLETLLAELFRVSCRETGLVL